MRTYIGVLLLSWVVYAQTGARAAGESLTLAHIPEAKPRSVIFILSDDHRYDAMSFMGHPFVETPTMPALRGDRYKYVHYQGVYDLDELYDLENDPKEINNLINSPEHQEIIRTMNAELFDTLEATGGMSIPLYRDRGPWNGYRREDGSHPGDFPDWVYVGPDDPHVRKQL